MVNCVGGGCRGVMVVGMVGVSRSEWCGVVDPLGDVAGADNNDGWRGVVFVGAWEM